MGIKNETFVATFVFSGLTDDEALVPFLFLFFLLVYMVTIAANVGMMALIFTSSSLQSPMYYFLSSLSLVDLFYSSVISPNTLSYLLSLKSDNSISFPGCVIQLYLFCALASTEATLLSTMSYDRYVAICHPLHYFMIMSKKKCLALVVYSCSISFLQSVVQTSCVFTLPFCGSNLIDHFYCDIPPLLKLSCSSTLHCDVITAILVGIWGLYTLTTIILSYIYIISSILKISSAQSRRKAFSTCSSHIICVSSFFTAVFFTYLCPHSGAFQIQDKMASIFYTAVTPMLNPLIYSMRNQEVKQVLVQAMRKSC